MNGSEAADNPATPTEGIDKNPNEGVDESVDEDVNADLSDALNLMLEEVERLKVSLEYFRLTDTPDKTDRIRWHVSEIDRRQDKIELLKTILLEQGEQQH